MPFFATPAIDFFAFEHLCGIKLKSYSLTVPKKIIKLV